MKYARIILPISLIFLLMMVTTSQASYIDDGSIVILRSQFSESADESIEIDGSLDEEAWSKAGMYSITYNQPVPLTMTIKYVNSLNFVYFGIKTTSFNSSINDSLLITFDTDGDAVLTSPEDGKLLPASGDGTDVYWDGTKWAVDGSSDSEDSQFSVATSEGSGTITFELKIGLIGDNLPYDGFRIPDPSSEIIAFNIQYLEHITQNSNTSPVVYNFPTVPSNATGYINMKLAGPEDQDLPEYNPPNTEIAGGPNAAPVAPIMDTVGAAMPLNTFWLMIPLIGISLVTYHRRREV